jgi:cell division transport system permease protein
MKTVRTIHRTTKFAFQNFWRNIWLTFATVLVFALTLVTINILIGLNQIAQTAIESVEDQIDVSVYFEQGTTEGIIFGAQEYLFSLSQVENVEYVSADDAYIRFLDRHKNNPDILQALDTVELNPFGGSLVVTATSPEHFDFILEALNNPTFGDSIKQKDFTDHKRVIERIENFTDRAMIFMYFLAGIFALIAILIVLNSIRVSIYTHREEIGIMKLVGANNSFVRLPFIIEAILMSLIATAITAAIVLPALQVIEPSLSTFFDGGEVGLYAYYTTNWLMIFGGQFAGLSILAMIASALALSRYLRF